MELVNDRLHERFDRLRLIVKRWELQVDELSVQAVSLFDSEDLEGISDLISQKKRLLNKIEGVQSFLQTWDVSS